MYTLSLILCLVALSATVMSATPAARGSLLPDAAAHFQQFIADFGRQYANEEERITRFQIFQQNLIKIDQLNARNKYATFGINKFADYTEKEMYSGALKSTDLVKSKCAKKTAKDITVKDVPEEWDWRQHGAVTKVKNQRTCGSCYAFSAIGNVEGQNAIKNKQLLDLSVQQVVDCDKYDDGCHGGWMNRTFLYLIEQNGIVSEKDYPYAEKRQVCSLDTSKIKVKLSGCNDFDLDKDEEVLKNLLYSNGPLSVAIDDSGLPFLERGIINNCSYNGPGHAVLIVGYGQENGVTYWILKNSWGEDWAENGFFRLERGSNQCGLMNYLISSAVI